MVDNPKLVRSFFSFPKKSTFKYKKDTPCRMDVFFEKKPGFGKYKTRMFNKTLRKYYLDSLYTGVYGYSSEHLSTWICYEHEYAKTFLGKVFILINYRKTMKKTKIS